MSYSTMQTGCLTGGVKKKSGVNVLPEVSETWKEVRNDKNRDLDWLLASYKGNSKTDITIIASGNGGLSSCAAALPSSIPVFGGVRLSNGRFVTFFYADDNTPTMQRGRASMHKNGVFNVLKGSDREIPMSPTFTED